MNISINSRHRPTAYLNCGFSMVEMLIVIAVIGVIAAIALPSIGNVNGAAKVATAQRNAQNAASVYTAGFAAGAPTFLAATSVKEAYAAMAAGDHGVGSMAKTNFKFATFENLDDTSVPADQKSTYYLMWEDGAMAYDPAGGH